jgi:hypothetical protein
MVNLKPGVFCESKVAGVTVIRRIAEKRRANLVVFISLNFKLKSTQWNSQNIG